ncbi:MAG: TusE/DsrC/DsvC family sulfur relay protein [Nitrospirae bacterium]|nr:TusE/DsrC/DsvC family sulfur relay protein [Nitrospirota bacterium]
MPTIDLKGSKVTIDREGYLEDPKNWSKEFAEYIAGQDGMEMSEDHWKAISAAREYFDNFGCVEMPHLVCRDAGLEANCMNRLFKGDIGEFEKLAGLITNMSMP